MHIKHFRLSTRQERRVCDGQGGGYKRYEMEKIIDGRQGTKGKRGERERRKKREAVSKEARKRKKWEGTREKEIEVGNSVTRKGKREGKNMSLSLLR